MQATDCDSATDATTRLLGTWRMISWTIEFLDTGEHSDALGNNPRGYVNYASDGRVMVLVLKGDRTTPASLVPTPGEKIALYDTMFAYSGTYSVQHDRVTHHLDMSWNKAWEGTDQIRLLNFDGERLTYRTSPAKNPFDGRECRHTVRFEKVHGGPNKERRCDRDFLLSPGKRNQIVELWEVEKFGADSFNNPDHVRIYGMKPSEWYGRGIRLLARTTLEAVSDQLGELIGKDVARVLSKAPARFKAGVVDPFAGSCNGLYSILRQLKSSKGLGFEIEPAIYENTARNIAALQTNIELINGSYKTLLPVHKVPQDHCVVAFLAPPWGDALSAQDGLDLSRTKPPIMEIVDDFENVYADQPILYVTQVHEHIEPTSLAALTSKFDWSELKIYDVNVPGEQHGILLGTRRWVPSSG
jgi:hypothetical protein